MWWTLGQAWKKQYRQIHSICFWSKEERIFISSQLTLLSSPPCCSPGLAALRPALAHWRGPLLPGRVLADRCSCCRSGVVWVEVVEGAGLAALHLWTTLSVLPSRWKTIAEVFRQFTLNCRLKTNSPNAENAWHWIKCLQEIIRFMFIYLEIEE